MKQPFSLFLFALCIIAFCSSAMMSLATARSSTQVGAKGEPLIVLPLSDYNNFYYTVNAHFGTDKSNTFKLLVNTNGGLLTVTSTLCGYQCWKHPKYDSRKSKTYKPDGRNVEWDIGEFQFYGTLANDQIALLGMDNSEALVVKNVTFAELVKASDSLEETYLQYDGLLGLSLLPEPSANNIFSFPSLMSYLVKQQLVSQRIFSVYLSEFFNMNQQHQKGKGALVLGGYSNDYYVGDMKFYPIPSDARHWSFEFDGLKVNGRLFQNLGCGIGYGKKCVAQLDTSAFTIFTDTYTFSYLQLGANVSIPADCSQIKLSSIPTFAFVIGGNDYVIKPQDYVIENKAPLFGQLVCQGAINQADFLQPGEWIFGAVFQSLFYTVYDQQNGRIGLATAKHN
ncbi:hypothetical protein FDP41_007154 [Naegleria fowleri]|uniref:Peptidase A1 domain-containing protein n=1 Tax=Naegleria fowleri TaxID=5763 RepID=A0A6A5B8P5_NAEFO|nr:uncharacterized protein FDP41_007154 [Naegleria fowleri]KAF0973767.1 hypothetical protein FDP41_007154 [Naegleria fowleri]CAG4714631.1 unnamed protein product [Naegleria fowleri]